MVGVLVISVPASANRAVSPGQVGTVEVWGANSACTTPLAETFDDADGGPWSALVRSGAGDINTFGVTGAGIVKRLGGTVAALNVPANLAAEPVKAIAARDGKAAVVTSSGAVQVWGDTRSFAPGTYSSPGLTAVDVTLGTTFAGVLFSNGTVGVVYSKLVGEEVATVLEVLPGVDDAVEVDHSNLDLRVRIAGGGIRSFAMTARTENTDTKIPAAARGDVLADPVVGYDSTSAVTASGVLVGWSTSTDLNTVPTNLVEGKIIDVADLRRATGGNWRAVLTDQNEVAVFGVFAPDCEAAMTTIPEGLDDKHLAALAGFDSTFSVIGYDLVAMTVSTEASIAAMDPKVGNTLTGTPATFTGGPDSVTNRWLADDEAIAGATGTTLLLTADQLGKTIKFESTATRGSETPVPSTSTGVGPVTPAAVASTTSLAASTRAYGSTGTASVTVSNTGGRPVTGTVTLTGAGAAQTRTLVGGKASFALPKTLTPRRYALKATYSGNADLTTSNRTSTYTVVRGRTSAPTFKASKTPTSKKSGKATVTVNTPSGLAKATGRVTVTIKGKSKKTIRVTLSGGKRTITLPKLKKGSYKVTLVYGGDSRYNSAKSKTYSLKVKK